MAASISDSQLSPNGFLTLQDTQNSIFSFPIEFPYEFDSFSPVDSTEAESSDEDEIAAGLTRSLTHHLALDPKKKETSSGSPKSTLSGIGSWSMSSNGSANGELSHPTTPPGSTNDVCEPICASAGDFSRLNQNTSFYSDQRFAYGVSRLENLDQVNQSYSVWGRQQLKAGPNHLQQNQNQNQIHSRGIGGTGYGNSRYVRPLGLPQSAWPLLQVQQNKHRSAYISTSAFVAGSGAKRGCAGTGVFLPRRFNDSTTYNNNSDCSTVMIPAKAEDYKTDGAVASKHDASSATKAGEAENGAIYELCLPQEWIY